MANVKAAWLRQGYFVLGNEGLMPAVRKELEQSLQLPKGHFSIHYYPGHAQWRHTYWWREGDDAYAEAQFVAHVSGAYPVLSVGLSVEKGYTVAPLGVVVPPEQMMTAAWDWHRVLPQLELVLTKEVPAIARTLGDVTLRIRTSTAGTDLTTAKPKRAWSWKAFTYADGTWYERQVGAVHVDTIATYVSAVDAKPDVWAILHLVHDLTPASAEGLSAPDLAHLLRQFDRARRRLRDLPVTANP